MRVPVPRSIFVPAIIPATVKFLFSLCSVPVPERLLIVAVLGRISVAPSAISISVVAELILSTVSVPA